MAEKAGKRPRLVRVLVVVGVLAALVLALPTIAAPIVKGRVEAALAERTGGTAALDTLSLGWSGTARLAGLRVTDAEGPVLSVAEATADVALLRLLGGKLRATVVAREVDLLLRQRDDGSWSADDWAAAREPDDGAKRDERIPELPELDLSLTGEVTLVGTGGTARVEALDVFTQVVREGLVSRITGTLVGFDGERGDVELKAGLGLTDGALHSLTLESKLDAPFLRGTLGAVVFDVGRLLTEQDDGPAEVQSLSADLVYRPAELGVLLGPLLPVPLSARKEGNGEEELKADLVGTLRALDADALVAGLRGAARVGLGRVTTRWLDAEGTLSVDLAEDAASWQAALTANGGQLDLSGSLDAQALVAGGDSGANLRLSATDVGVTSRLAPLLTHVHPAFAAFRSLEASQVSGVVAATLELGYDGPLESLAALDQTKVRGRGDLAVTGARLAGAPALNQMLSFLGFDPAAEVRTKPVSFAIDAGRLTYDRAWTWTLKGVATTFTGSVGLDRTLDLAWNVPVTPEAVAAQGLLAPLQGRTLALPITGTVQDPKLEWRGAATELLKTVAKDEVLGAVRDKLGEAGLGDLDLEGLKDPDKLGGVLDQVLGGGETSEGATDPRALLAEADRLWDAGQRDEAAVLYRELREKHKLTLVYTLNRDRIKERGKHGDP